MQTIIEAFHLVPLFLIALLLAAPYIMKIIRKQNLIIKSLDPLLLMLSAIGVAAGANAHDAAIIHYSFDPCFGYAAVVTCVAARMLGLFQKKIVVTA